MVPGCGSHEKEDVKGILEEEAGGKPFRAAPE
jgi:hypothetical protein